MVVRNRKNCYTFPIKTLERGDEKMILANKITEEKKGEKNGWSQEELANQLGVSRQAVSKWEVRARFRICKKSAGAFKALWSYDRLSSER